MVQLNSQETHANAVNYVRHEMAGNPGMGGAWRRAWREDGDEIPGGRPPSQTSIDDAGPQSKASGSSPSADDELLAAGNDRLARPPTAALLVSGALGSSVSAQPTPLQFSLALLQPRRSSSKGANAQDDGAGDVLERAGADLARGRRDAESLVL